MATVDNVDEFMTGDVFAWTCCTHDPEYMFSLDSVRITKDNDPWLSIKTATIVSVITGRVLRRVLTVEHGELIVPRSSGAGTYEVLNR